MATLPIHHPLAATTTREPVREPARAQRPVEALIVKSCLPSERRRRGYRRGSHWQQFDVNRDPKATMREDHSMTSGQPGHSNPSHATDPGADVSPVPSPPIGAETEPTPGIGNDSGPDIDDGSTPSEKKKSFIRFAGIVALVLIALAGYIAFVLSIDIQPGQGTAVGGAAVLGAAIITYFGANQTRQSHEKTAEAQLEADRDELRHAKQHAAKVAAAADRAFSAQQREIEAATRRDEVRDLRSRFDSATARLAADGLAPRLSGVYALAAVADEWFSFGSPIERQICIDVLCAYLRTPLSSTDSIKSDPATAQVQATILNVIADRTAARPHEVAGSDRDWRDCDFDFSNARMPSITLDDCQFRGRLNCNRTEFSSLVSFRGSHLANATFEFAIFQHAQFSTATLGAKTFFRGAAFSGNTLFQGITFEGMTDFSNIIVDDSRIDFQGSTFQTGSTTLLRSCELKRKASLDLSSCRFNGGAVDVRYVRADPESTVLFYQPNALVTWPRGDWDDKNHDDPMPAYLRPQSWPPKLSPFALTSLGLGAPGPSTFDDTNDA